MEQFGWRGNRQNPVHQRPQDLTALQPAEFANGLLVQRATRLSEDHDFTALALQEELTLDELTDAVYLQIFTREPTLNERALVAKMLATGYSNRRRPNAPRAKRPLDRRGMVSWSVHQEELSSQIKKELQGVVRRGDPATNRLVSDWRERLEDVVWSMVNSPEFRFAP
jgi:hypothetical protein